MNFHEYAQSGHSIKATFVLYIIVVKDFNRNIPYNETKWRMKQIELPLIIKFCFVNVQIRTTHRPATYLTLR